MKASLFLTAVISLSISGAVARTWTSADGTKTFEGEFRSYNAASGIVTVLINGRAVNVPTEKLSEADIAFLKEADSKPQDAAPATPDTETEIGAKVAKAKLQRLDGERYKRAELEKNPKYYILYYSASW
jgi:hypothetical protein